MWATVAGQARETGTRCTRPAGSAWRRSSSFRRCSPHRARRKVALPRRLPIRCSRRGTSCSRASRTRPRVAPTRRWRLPTATPNSAPITSGCPGRRRPAAHDRRPGARRVLLVHQRQGARDRADPPPRSGSRLARIRAGCAWRAGRAGRRVPPPHPGVHPETRVAYIQYLRQLHKDPDRVVLAAYGWSDIPVPP